SLGRIVGTVLGNDLFAYFQSTECKSRLNFLQVLQGSQRGYALNETTLAYWSRQKLAAALVSQLTQGPQAFVGEAAWQARLPELAITDERHIRIVTESALLGSLVAQRVSSSWPVCASHTFSATEGGSDGCPEPLARRLPSGLKATLKTLPSDTWREGVPG